MLMTDNKTKNSWIQSWHVTPSAGSDFDVIDGLRGIAILLVVVAHTMYVDPSYGFIIKVIGGIIPSGGWGVSIFFALSGFLISYPFWKRKIKGEKLSTPGGYAQRRFWKIYPPLAISCILLGPAYSIINKDATYIMSASKWLVGIPLLLPVDGRFNAVMWSLIVEVHFYLVLPLLFMSVKKISVKNSILILFLILFFIPKLYRYWDLYNNIHIELYPNLNTYFPSLLDSFAFGVAFSGIHNLYQISKKYVVLGDLGCFIFLSSMISRWCLNIFPSTGYTKIYMIQDESFDFIVKIACGLMLFYVLDQNYFSVKIISNPLLRWFGLISYEWYLFHQPIYQWTKKFMGNPHGSLIKFAITNIGSFICSIILACIIYRYFSLPILKKMRKDNLRIPV